MGIYWEKKPNEKGKRMARHRKPAGRTKKGSGKSRSRQFYIDASKNGRTLLVRAGL